jgi:hypothetical protein
MALAVANKTHVALFFLSHTIFAKEALFILINAVFCFRADCLPSTPLFTIARLTILWLALLSSSLTRLTD